MPILHTTAKDKRPNLFLSDSRLGPKSSETMIHTSSSYADINLYGNPIIILKTKEIFYRGL